MCGETRGNREQWMLWKAIVPLLVLFAPSGALPCKDFCVTPVQTNGIIGQEAVVFYCSANASSLKWQTIPGRREVGGNATTVVEDGIFVSRFVIPVVARNNETNVACCIYNHDSGTWLCSNTTMLVYTQELPPTQSEDGASVNARKEGDVSSAIINAASAFAVAAGLVVSLLLSCVA